jgi:hypothetical protein
MGLRLEAEKIGILDRKKCPNCLSMAGAKLNPKRIEMLFHNFFWNGSYFRAEFGGATRLVSNPYHYGKSEIKFPDWLKKDADLLQNKLQVGLLHHGPALWRIGEITPLTNLRDPKTRRLAVTHIIDNFPVRLLSCNDHFYRIRLNLNDNQEADFSQYDAPPTNRSSFGRLDSANLSVLYGSEDLEICIHECRVTIPDECFVALMRPKLDLRMLDLTAAPSSTETTPFESLEIAMRFLFSAGSASYEMTRAIALEAQARGFDGMYYPSYFSNLKDMKVPNVAIFGRPISEKRIEIRCINRGMLKSANYDLQFGPIFS